MPPKVSSEMVLNVEPQLKDLIKICKDEFTTVEVWLFGSRARGDHRDDSDWDILLVVPDSTPPEKIKRMHIWEIARSIDINMDLLAVRKNDFKRAKHSVSTLCYEAVSDGMRIDL